MLAAYCRGFAATNCLGFRLSLGKSAWPGLASRCHFSDENDHANEKPLPFQLEHVRTRLMHTLPRIFRERIDYTFYHPNVVCEDHIFNVRRVGLDSFRRHIGNITFFACYFLPHIEMSIVSILPVLEDGTVRCRWRVEYVSFPRLLLNPRLFKYDYRIKNLSWYDGYSVLTVDGNGDVTKVTIQKTRRDDHLIEDSTKEKLQKAIKSLQPVAGKRAPAAQMTFVDVDKDSKFESRQGNSNSEFYDDERVHQRKQNSSR